MPATRRLRCAATRATHTVQGETLLQRLFLLRFLHAEFGFRPDVAQAHDLRGDSVALTPEVAELAATFLETGEHCPPLQPPMQRTWPRPHWPRRITS